MPDRRSVLFLVFASLIAAPFVSAQDEGNQTGDQNQTGDGGAGAEGAYVINVTAQEEGCPGGDPFCFDPALIRVKPGSNVTIHLANPEGNTAGHNFIIEDLNVMIPGPSTDDLLMPGEEANATFTVPTVEGAHDFYCQPHQAAGMTGVLEVSEDAPGPGEEDTGPVDGGPEEAGPENGAPGFGTLAVAVAAVGTALLAGRHARPR